ncbi:hypothetical protein PTKIN_Ptkin07bG0308400 [Pterospermum kingtungense]
MIMKEMELETDSVIAKSRQTNSPPPPPPPPLPRFWARRNYSEEDYKCFEESLNDEEDNAKEKITAPTNTSKGDKKNNEIRVGIKDWWTKSKYAYLNQPAFESSDNPKRRASTYTPNFFNFKPTPLYPTSLGVF